MVTHAEGTQLSGELSLTQKSDLAAPCWCCSGTQLCPTLFDPVDCSTAGFPVHRSLLEFAYALSWSLLTLSPGVCLNSSLLSWCCLPTISSCVAPYSSCPQSFPASESFPMSQLFESGGQRTGASASVLPINIQGFPPSICGEVIGSDALILGVPFRHG